MFSISLLLLSFVGEVLSATASQPCPLVGPDVQAPKNLSGSSSMQTATSDLQQELQSALNGSLSTLNASFAIDVFSIHEENSVFTYLYNAPKWANATQGVHTLTDNTIFRIGSISKLYTVYVGLLTVKPEYWSQPITNFIPELSQYMANHPNSTDTYNVIDFNAITLYDLASQLSGLTRDNSGSRTDDESLQKLLPGLPSPPASLPDNITYLDNCPEGAYLPCTRSTFIANFLSRDPLLPVASQPAYSNINFGLFGLAVENITSTSFSTLLKNTLIDPLGLNSTYYDTPSDLSNAFIPSNTSGFSDNLFDSIPAGGFYSSLADIRKITRSILSSTLLPQAVTNRWLKANSLTSSPLQSVGAPWEIYTYAPTSGRTIDIYTKSGSIGVYHSLTALIPVYDVSFTLWSAGDGDATPELQTLVVGALLPALSAASYEEAQTLYEGIYTDANTNSSITIRRPTTAYNQSGPGLQVTQYTYEGFDMLSVFTLFYGALNVSDTDLRLYPSGLQDQAHSSWRGFAYSKASYQMAAPDDPAAVISTYGGGCPQWFGWDGTAYGGITFNDFLFRVDSSGRAVGLTPRVWKTEYLRQS